MSAVTFAIRFRTLAFSSCLAASLMSAVVSVGAGRLQKLKKVVMLLLKNCFVKLQFDVTFLKLREIVAVAVDETDACRSVGCVLCA